MSSMPILPVDRMCADLGDYEGNLIRAAFIRKTSKLRTTKPYRKASTDFEGCANYVWRMLCFDFVGSNPHSCIPITADFDISGDYADRRKRTEFLDAVIKQAESVLPVIAQAGVMRWRGLV